MARCYQCGQEVPEAEQCWVGGTLLCPACVARTHQFTARVWSANKIIGGCVSIGIISAFLIILLMMASCYAILR